MLNYPREGVDEPDDEFVGETLVKSGHADQMHLDQGVMDDKHHILTKRSTSAQGKQVLENVVHEIVLKNVLPF